MPSGGRFEGGDVSFALGFAAGKGYVVRHWRLSDGAPLAALAFRDPSGAAGCVPGLHPDDPKVVGIFQSSPNTYRFAVLDASQPEGMRLGKVVPSSAAFHTRVRYAGGIGNVASGGIELYPSLDATTSTILRVDSWGASAEGDMLVYSATYEDTTTTGLLGAFVAGRPAPVRLVPNPPRRPTSVRLSETHLVWVGSASARLADGFTDASRFYRTVRTTDPARVVVEEGPEIPKNGGSPSDLATAGDLAAVRACESAEQYCVIVVANLATNQRWVIGPRPGHGYSKLLAVSPTEVVVAEDTLVAPDRGARGVTGILRFAVADLDTLAARLPAP